MDWTLPAPLPTRDDMVAARESVSERRRVDEMYAAACGIVGEDVPAFLARLALYDVHEQARQEEAAATRLLAARARRAEIGEPVMLRNRRLTRRRPAA